MTPRDVLVRAVLVIASAASLATSLPPDTLEARAAGNVRAPDPRHVSVLLDEEAAQEADEIWIHFRWPEGEVHDVIAIVPDDDALPALQLVTDAPESLEASAACRGAGGCSIGFTLDPSDAEPEPTTTTVEVTAEVIRHSGDFSSDASVQVVFDAP